MRGTGTTPDSPESPGQNAHRVGGKGAPAPARPDRPLPEKCQKKRKNGQGNGYACLGRRVSTRSSIRPESTSGAQKCRSTSLSCPLWEYCMTRTFFIYANADCRNGCVARLVTGLTLKHMPGSGYGIWNISGFVRPRARHHRPRGPLTPPHTAARVSPAGGVSAVPDKEMPAPPAGPRRGDRILCAGRWGFASFASTIGSGQRLLPERASSAPPPILSAACQATRALGPHGWCIVPTGCTPPEITANGGSSFQ